MTNVFKFPTNGERKPLPRRISNGKIGGNHLSDYGIFEGDVVFIDNTLPVKDGDFVLVKTDTGDRVFKIYLENGEIVLNGKVIKQSEILGRVFRLERNL